VPGMAQNLWGGTPDARFTRSRRLGEGKGRCREAGSEGSPIQKRGATCLRATHRQVNRNWIPIPLPPLDAQRRIVAELEKERKLVDLNRELIARMEAKIKTRLDEIWGSNEV